MPPVSKIAQMPADIREWLHKAFVARGFGDIEAITDEVNALMKEAGVAITIGKSAIGVESQKVRRAQEAIRATTEAAKLIADASPDVGDNRSAAAMAIVQTEVFDILLKIRETDEEDDGVRLKAMSNAALLLSRLSRTRVYQSRWNEEVEAKARAAADSVAKIAKTGGLSTSQVNEIRSQILGITEQVASGGLMVTRKPSKPTSGRVSGVARAARATVAAATLARQLAIAAALADTPAVDPTTELHTSAKVEAQAPPPVLLVYQQKWIADQAQLKICEKGRRVGLTWAEAADAVLTAAAEGGTNYFYISATQDMAREFVEACAMWTRAFHHVAGEIGEGVYDDGEDKDGSKRFIKTYEIVFPKSGRRIVALSSRPTNLRGKQGTIGIDEAAFHNDLAALIKAAMAMLLWGDKVRIWSTHDGAENPFAQLIDEVRAGKRGGPDEASVHRVTFQDAINDGLYRRVCLRRGLTWSAEAEKKWAASAYRFYGDDAAEELDAIPSQSAGAYLSLALISQRMTNAETVHQPGLVRAKWEDGFAYLAEDTRRFAIRGWCEEKLKPHLDRLSPVLRHTFGQDFARNRDQSVITVLEEDHDLRKRPALTIELGNCPFSSQEQILEYVIDALLPKRFRGGAMDATGNGAAIAEKMAQKYGVEMIEQVKLHDGFYLAHMPKLRGELQDGTLLDIPRDDAIRDDLRSIKLVGGIPKIPKGDTQSAGAKAAAAEGGEKLRRHGDFAIALFLGIYAFHREVGEIDWTAVPAGATTWGESASAPKRLGMRPNHDDDAFGSGGFGGSGAD